MVQERAIRIASYTRGQENRIYLDESKPLRDRIADYLYGYGEGDAPYDAWCDYVEQQRAEARFAEFYSHFSLKNPRYKDDLDAINEKIELRKTSDSVYGFSPYGSALSDLKEITSLDRQIGKRNAHLKADYIIGCYNNKTRLSAATQSEIIAQEEDYARDQLYDDLERIAFKERQKRYKDKPTQTEDKGRLPKDQSAKQSRIKTIFQHFIRS